MRLNFLVCAILFLCLTPLSFAHGGPTFEKQTNGYFIDIGYDEQFEAGQETLLDFALFHSKNGKVESLVQVTSVTFLVQTGSTVLHTQTIAKPDFGKIFATYTPNAFGHFDFTVLFFVDGTSVAEATFPLEVKRPNATHYSVISGSNVPMITLGIALVAIVLVFLRRTSFFH